ncbi:hypothetical protein ONZ43_g4869 [Nemania bipapillata]|uniref:Uncharacterized protein n=1 Tax=Nemania bipapillata TaxID=110536 RepID=A0ACC2IHK9_9PEZI|nr:hypothetical protein ONZ43_g4869 [Nemania bipapillata]
MSQNPYQQGPSAEQGYGYDQEHELQNYGQQPAAPHTLPQHEFLGRIDFLRNEIVVSRASSSNVSSPRPRA